MKKYLVPAMCSIVLAPSLYSFVPFDSLIAPLRGLMQGGDITEAKAELSENKKQIQELRHELRTDMLPKVREGLQFIDGLIVQKQEAMAKLAPYRPILATVSAVGGLLGPLGSTRLGGLVQTFRSTYNNALALTQEIEATAPPVKIHLQAMQRDLVELTAKGGLLDQIIEDQKAALKALKKVQTMQQAGNVGMGLLQNVIGGF